MSTALKMVQVDAPSQKKEQFIQLGKTRRRISTRHHAKLSKLQEAFGYMTMEQLLMMTSDIGSSVLEIMMPALLINVDKCARED